MKLQVYQSYWGMAGLPFNGENEWSMEEKEHRAAMLPLCEKYGLKRSNIVFPLKSEDFSEDIKAAIDGGASHINLQPMPMPRNVAEGVPYIVRCMDMAKEAGYELFFETHRDRMTTDMYFTLDLIEAVPDMILCGDLSHFLVGREFAGPPLSKQNQSYMEQILDRCGAFHGRVASREQVQVPTQFPHNKVWVDLYESWWEYGFKRFRSRAKEGDVLTFVVELGPPTYAIQGADGKELSDRWEEAVIMKDRVRSIWDNC